MKGRDRGERQREVVVPGVGEVGEVGGVIRDREAEEYFRRL